MADIVDTASGDGQCVTWGFVYSGLESWRENLLIWLVF
jgi:hypothetical protein